jgi:hypothetical protein
MRRLPVIQESTSDDALAASRPAWHWVLIGSGFVTTIWLPFAVLAASFGALPLLVCFGLSAFAGGALVGRFGGRARAREAGISAILAAFLVTSVALLGGSGLSPLVILLASVVLAALGGVAGYLGGGFGVRRRPVLGSNQ